MANIGQTPPDYSAPIGRFRLLAQDTNYIDLNPVVTGQGSYDLFSDAEVSGYIAMFEGYSMYRSVAAAYLAMAGRAAMAAKMTKDFDLQVDLTKRQAALNEAAAAFQERAEEEDLRNGVLSDFGLTAPANAPTLAQLSQLPMEQWAFVNGIDIPTTAEGGPPFSWPWSN